MVGVVATLIDVGGLVFLAEALGWPVWLSDAASVGAATVVSYLLHTARTSSEHAPSRRWFTSPGPYWQTAIVALVVDVVVLSVLFAFLRPGWWLPLVVIKVVSLAAAFLVRSSAYRDLMFKSVRDVQAEPARRSEPEGEVRLSVVVPAYREADRIASTVERIRSELRVVAEDGGLEIVVVDDGSPDGTAQQARGAGADVVLRQERNRGKGAAVRAGMMASKGRTVAFTDADLAYAPAQLARLTATVEQGWDVVVGSRRHTATLTVARSGRLRELGGRIINVCTGLVLLGRYRDTQCGLKAFRRDVAQLVFAHTAVDGFAFDVEVFHLVERYRLTLTEVHVEVENSQRSTVHVVRDAARLLIDLVRVRQNDRVGVYDIDDTTLPLPGGPTVGEGGPN